MLYNTLKILHILSAVMVLSSIAYCFHLWRSLHKSRDMLAISDRIQTQTWIVIIPFALVQLSTGFTMISLEHYDFSEIWVTGSVISFIVVIGSWFSFLYFLLLSQQVTMASQNNSQLKFYRRVQSFMLLLCALALSGMIFFMTNKTVRL